MYILIHRFIIYKLIKIRSYNSSNNHNNNNKKPNIKL